MDSSNLIFILAPIYALLIGAEFIISFYNKRVKYEAGETFHNIVIGIGYVATTLIGPLLFTPIFLLVEPYKLFDIGVSVYSILGCYFFAEFIAYWWHVASHKLRFLWVMHCVHHSATNINLSLNFRQSWLTELLGMQLLFLPIVFIGFPIEVLFGVFIWFQLFQILSHTEIIRSLGWFDLLFNSPSSHRVHHAINDKYFNRNYGFTTMIFDHIFGTFQREDQKDTLVYGVLNPPEKRTVWSLQFSELTEMFRDVFGISRTKSGAKALLEWPNWRRKQEP